MPLYMDIHSFAKIPVGEVKEHLLEEESAHKQHGIRHHQFWINEKKGLVFCLMESPDKASIEKVHKNGRCNSACNLSEVTAGFFNLCFGDGQTLAQKMHPVRDVSVDVSFRHFLVAQIQINGNPSDHLQPNSSIIPPGLKNLLREKIARFEGYIVEQSEPNYLTGIFSSATNSLQCAGEIQEDLKSPPTAKVDSNAGEFIFRMGLSTLKSRKTNDKDFMETWSKTKRLCLAARENRVIVSPFMWQECNTDLKSPMMILTIPQEHFIHRIYDITENNMASESFNVNQLSKKLGISRPQLYRKVKLLTGKTPSRFITSLRMAKALKLLRENSGNVLEIALEVGFNSPSYFSKCFRRSFGYQPSAVIRFGGNS